MSTVDFDAACASLSALGAAMFDVDEGLLSPSCFVAAGFDGASVEVDLCGMFLISLYFGCLDDIPGQWTFPLSSLP